MEARSLSFNGDFPPRRCSERQRRRGEGRHYSLGNKPWKKELHHQECVLDKKLEDDALMEEKKERRGEHKIEGIKEGEKWNFEVLMDACLWSFYGGWIFELQ